MPRRTLGRLLALGLVTQTARLGAQAAPAPAAAPRVAVVLSGGGAKGLAHVGVLRVLEEEGVSPQIVAGTSMGALIGGLYAMGDSPAVLDSLARHLDWNAYFNDAPARALLGLDRRLQGDRTVLELPLTRAGPTLPAGVLGGQRIGELLARLTWHAQLVRDFRTLPRSFVAVATDIGRGEAVALDHGSLATVMQASMALPSVFAPVTLDGRVFIDGGVTRNLPAQDARALGADVVICSDVSEGLVPAAQLHTLVDVLTQAVSIHDAASAAAERARCDVYIRPDITGLTGTSYDSAGVAIARGVAAADAVREALRAFRSADPPAARARHGAWPDSIRVARVVVEGVTGNAERAARYAIGTRAHGWVTADRLDSLVQQLYSSERYDGVRSRLEATGGDTAVVLSLAPRAQDRLGVGLRYDDTFRAAILLTARIRSRVAPGATTQLDLRLGEQLRASIERAWASLRDPRAHYAIAAAYTETHLPIYDGDRRVAQAKLAVVTARGFVGRTFGTAGGIGIQLKGEHSRASSDVSAGDSASRAQTVASGALLLAWDALDRADFPRRGVEAIARSERAVGGTRFVQHLARGQIAVPLAPRVTLRGRAVVGASTAGDALPLQSRFAVGGTYPAPLYPDMQVPLVGLHPQEQLGAAAVAVGPGVQVELRPNVFATVRGDVGYAGRALTLDRRVYRSGGAASLGALTAFGPAELTVSRATGRRRARVEFTLGRRF